MDIDLKNYFETTAGKGFLSTANKKGEVNIAVYSRPRVMEDEHLAFGMTPRLTYANLQENPYAVYAYNERGFQGLRLYLEKVREEYEGPLLEEIRQRADHIVGPGTGDAVKAVVYFKINKILPLVTS